MSDYDDDDDMLPEELYATPPAEHVVVENTKEGGYRFKCMRCRAQYVPSLPVPLDMFLAMGKSFEKTHVSCEEVDGIIEFWNDLRPYRT